MQADQEDPSSLKDPMDYKCHQLLLRTIISQKHLFSVDLYVDSFIKSLTDQSEHLAHTHTNTASL